MWPPTEREKPGWLCELEGVTLTEKGNTKTVPLMRRNIRQPNFTQCVDRRGWLYFFFFLPPAPFMLAAAALRAFCSAWSFFLWAMSSSVSTLALGFFFFAVRAVLVPFREDMLAGVCVSNKWMQKDKKDRFCFSAGARRNTSGWPTS
eukprot:INCI10903.1.p1 GENE.INCI10903.1~~INCI10903.1.p1  ORF type:complete len:147 (+),score=15.10 INCI10903.1:229-669(+)